ncbi:MAG: DEAD/DEAH box helicase [Candidatus Aureabacteria bacterium]|nr:DEAD/DEAH box helicase [Candidatus Auribacterota bacterium]
MNQSPRDFYSLGIAPGILDMLDTMNFKIPTPIQHKAIPPITRGDDIIGIAQTGTGKTLAFGIPMVQSLAQKKGQALILVPTRELAIQVDNSLKEIADRFSLNRSVLIGGASMTHQMDSLKKNPRIFIATPGRLMDHLERRSLSLSGVRIVILDEADRMLDMGFVRAIERILKMVPRERQTLLFSATMPEAVMKIASAHMKLPIHLEIAPSGTAAERVTQELFILKKELKNQLLQRILNEYKGSILIFSRTKHGAAKITRTIRTFGHKVAEIHSNKTLGQRRHALEGFKSGIFRVLVATDIAARGIDVAGIELVVNYDLPDDAENYVHRIGRTGRAGHEGHAISFAMPDQRNEVKKIESLIRMAIPISNHPEVPMENFAKPRIIFSAGHHRRRR